MEAIEQLKVGGQYTIVSFNLNGYPFAHTFRIVQKVGTYEYGTLTLYCLPKHVRSLLRLHPRRQFIIWDGEVKPDVRIYAVTIHNREENTAQDWLWESNSPHYMERAFKSVKEVPLIKNYPDPAGYSNHHVMGTKHVYAAKQEDVHANH